jgi:hypothetical protein
MPARRWQDKLNEIDRAIDNDEFEPNDWEVDFLDSIDDHKYLTPKQETALNNILDKTRRKQV